MTWNKPGKGEKRDGARQAVVVILLFPSEFAISLLFTDRSQRFDIRCITKTSVYNNFSLNLFDILSRSKIIAMGTFLHFVRN